MHNRVAILAFLIASMRDYNAILPIFVNVFVLNALRNENKHTTYIYRDGRRSRHCGHNARIYHRLRCDLRTCRGIVADSAAILDGRDIRTYVPRTQRLRSSEDRQHIPRNGQRPPETRNGVRPHNVAPQFRRRIRRLLDSNTAMLRKRVRHSMDRYGRDVPHNELRMSQSHSHIRRQHVGGVVYHAATPLRRRRTYERPAGGTHTRSTRHERRLQSQNKAHIRNIIITSTT